MIAGFGAVIDEQAVRFLGTAREERYEEGQPITERWERARTFYIVIDGRLSVRLNDREVNVLGTGDHFGEIAAIDWGRDFSYGRTAAVIATAPTSVLAFPASALRELMADAPEVDRSIRRIAQTRLRSS
jgi:CRP-like cAMP-binding protein